MCLNTILHRYMSQDTAAGFAYIYIVSAVAYIGREDKNQSNARVAFIHYNNMRSRTIRAFIVVLLSMLFYYFVKRFPVRSRQITIRFVSLWTYRARSPCAEYLSIKYTYYTRDKTHNIYIRTRGHDIIIIYDCAAAGAVSPRPFYIYLN